jgi:hypothetical protein
LVISRQYSSPVRPSHIFSVPILRLVTRREYSNKILSPCPPIGHTSRIL